VVRFLLLLLWLAPAAAAQPVLRWGGDSEGGAPFVEADPNDPTKVEGFDVEVAEEIAFHQNAMGAVAGPFDAFLARRGLRALGVRMDRRCDNAERVVDFLLDHAKVAEVMYPGLESHPGHATAQRQMKRFGGIVSFRVAGGEQQALDVCAREQVFTLGESLGGVESLIEHPGRMTHASVAGTDLEVPADLIRLSVGIETVEDLIADLDRALA